MSTAAVVPETWRLTGDDARRTLASTGYRALFYDAYQRLQWSDGLSHARSLAFMVTLTAVQGLIALVGVATTFGDRSISDSVVTAVQAAAPGPVSDLLTTAVVQAQRTGSSHSYLGLTLGLLGCLLTTTTAFGQLERGLNRLYGVEEDRPPREKYRLALLLAASAGVLLATAFVALTLGRSLATSTDNDRMRALAAIAMWPLGAALLTGALALLFRWCPRRHQPAWSWLAFGSSVSLVLWIVVTAGLGLFLRHSSSFGQTYGPLAGMAALMLWSMMISVALFFGAALAAQLEAVRADVAEPRDEQKATTPEPAVAGAGTGGD